MGEKRLLQLNELEEIRNESYDNARYKDKMKKWHDQCIVQKTFEEGDRVLIFNSRLIIFLRKLKSQWTDVRCELYMILSVFFMHLYNLNAKFTPYSSILH